MRRRSKTARLSGGAVGVEDQLVVAQTQARQVGRLDGQGLRQDLRERVLGILTLHTPCQSFPATSSYLCFYDHPPPPSPSPQKHVRQTVNPTIFLVRAQ